MKIDPKMKAALFGVGMNMVEKILPEGQKGEAIAGLVREIEGDGLAAAAFHVEALTAGQAENPVTKLARPAFIYVMAAYLVFAVVLGVVGMFSPATAANMTEAMRGWLMAVPDAVWTLFGVTYLGYTGARTVEKKSGVAK